MPAGNGRRCFDSRAPVTQRLQHARTVLGARTPLPVVSVGITPYEPRSELIESFATKLANAVVASPSRRESTAASAVLPGNGIETISSLPAGISVVPSSQGRNPLSIFRYTSPL